jgi:hypothetical protein
VFPCQLSEQVKKEETSRTILQQFFMTAETVTACQMRAFLLRSPSTLCSRLRHTLCRQQRCMNIGRVLKIECSNFLMMT